MLDFRTVKIGDKVKFESHDFDGAVTRYGVVTEVEDDHAIVRADGMNLWLDDYTAGQFSLIASRTQFSMYTMKELLESYAFAISEEGEHAELGRLLSIGEAYSRVNRAFELLDSGESVDAAYRQLVD